jgi:hypothetical protein
MIFAGETPAENSFKLPKYGFLLEKCKFFPQIEILSFYHSLRHDISPKYTTNV